MAMSVSAIDLKSIEITDQARIKKYMDQYLKFFIPANEHDTFDTELLESEILFKSSEVIGQHHPIEVAILENDPNPESSPYRIHLRPIDGRHRYKDALKHGQRWACRFYDVKDYSQFMTLRGHFDAKKTITRREREEYFLNLCKYYEDVLGMEPQLICAAIVRDYSPPFHQAVIRHYVLDRYKNQDKVRACLKSVPTRHPMPIREIQEKKPENIRNDYARFNREIDRLEKENEFMRASAAIKIIEEPIFVLEEMGGNSWTWVHVCADEKAARDELQHLDPGRFRIRKTTFVYDYIYQPTSDKAILKKRRQREAAKRHHEKKKKKS